MHLRSPLMMEGSAFFCSLKTAVWRPKRIVPSSQQKGKNHPEIKRIALSFYKINISVMASLRRIRNATKSGSFQTQIEPPNPSWRHPNISQKIAPSSKDKVSNAKEVRRIRNFNYQHQRKSCPVSTNVQNNSTNTLHFLQNPSSWQPFHAAAEREAHPMQSYKEEMIDFRFFFPYTHRWITLALSFAFVFYLFCFLPLIPP